MKELNFKKIVNFIDEQAPLHGRGPAIQQYTVLLKVTQDKGGTIRFAGENVKSRKEIKALTGFSTGNLAQFENSLKANGFNKTSENVLLNWD